MSPNLCLGCKGTVIFYTEDLLGAIPRRGTICSGVYGRPEKRDEKSVEPVPAPAEITAHLIRRGGVRCILNKAGDNGECSRVSGLPLQGD